LTPSFRSLRVGKIVIALIGIEPATGCSDSLVLKRHTLWDDADLWNCPVILRRGNDTSVFPLRSACMRDPTQVTNTSFIENRYAPSALHILTTASLHKLSQLGSVGQTDRRRFRPSILIESDETNVFLENDWIGRTLHIGDICTTVLEGTKRCGMTLIAQPWHRRGAGNSPQHFAPHQAQSWRLRRG